MSAIRVQLELEDGQFTTRLLHAGESIQRFNQNVARSYPHLQSMAAGGQLVFKTMQQIDAPSKRFLATMRDLAVVAGGVSLAASKLSGIMNGFIGDIVRVNAEFERFTVMLAAMSRAADPMKDAADQMDQFRKIALEVPVSLNAILNSATKLSAVGIKPLDGSLRNLIDGIAAFGGSEESMTRATLAITQMMGKGVIQMEELRQQLGEAIPRAIELMARSMGATVPEFMKAVATGTVEAKSAIESFNAELERTFAGRGTMMLKTFDGQLQRTKALLQNLALTTGESGQEGGFFAGLKRGLEDFNNFLASNNAQKFAQMLGEGLSSVVVAFRQAIEVAIDFSQEIQRAAVAAGVFFAAMLAKGAMTSVIAFFNSMRLQMVALGGQITALKTSWATMTAVMSGAAVTSMATGQAMTGMAAAFGVARTAAIGLGSGLAIATGGLSLIIPALMLAAEYFDWFSDAADDAQEKAKQFGIANLKQYDEYYNALKGKIDKLQAEADRIGDKPRLISFMGMIGTNEGELNRRKEILKEIEALEAELNKYYPEALKGSIREANEVVRSQLAERLQTVTTAYDQEMIEIDRREQERTERMQQSGELLQTIQDEADKDRLKAQADRYRAELKMIEDFIAAQYDVVQIGNEDQKKIAFGNIAILREAYARASSALNGILRQQNMGITTITPPEDIEKLLEKSRDAVTDLKQDIAQTSLRIRGMTKDMAKFNAEVESGKYGPKNDPRVQAIIKQLKFAIELKAELDKALNIQDEITSDAADTIQGLRDELFDLQTANMTEAEKFALRSAQKLDQIPAGMKLNLQLEGLTTGLKTANTEAQNAATTLVNSLFGTEVQNNARTVIGLINEMTEAIGGVNGAVGMIFGNTPVGDLRGGGLPGRYAGGGGFVDALIGAESSGNATADNPNSTARGLGQFIESTWMQFLREMRPDLGGLSRQEQLALRDDPGMSRQAIEWYANKNAEALMRSGLQPTNPNLYLSHFLGSGDAIKVLSSAITTPLEQILSPKKIAANDFLAGKDVGWLIEWATRKMGNAAPLMPSAQTSAAPAGVSTTAPSDAQIAAARADNEAQIRELQAQIAEAEAQLGKANVAAFGENAAKQIEQIMLSATGASDAVLELRKRIESGEFGGSRNADNIEEYKTLYDWVKKVDEAQLAADEKLAARRDVDSSMDERKKKIEELNAALEASANGPDPYENHKQALRELISYYDDLLAKAKLAYGAESETYKSLLAEKNQALRLSNDANFNDTMQTLKDMMEDTNIAYDGDVRNYQAALEKKKQELMRYAEYENMTAEQRAQVNAQINAVMVQQQKLMQEEIRKSDPFAQQMASWADLSTNTSRFVAGAFDSLSGTLSTFIMKGKADWKGMVDSLLSDAIRLATNWAFSMLLGGGGGGKGGGAKALLGGGAKAATGGGKKAAAAAVMHEGGIVGRGRSRTRMINPAAFIGAQRFHTGGMIQGMGLAPGEVPIIAQKGEGVFTKDQMRNMAKSQGAGPVNLTSNVTVNASGGTPEQNDDLAKKVSQQVEGSIRGLVAKEMRAQMRPGGTLAR